MKTKLPLLFNDREVECIAKNIYFEARGEPHLGKEAVALVLVSRVKHPKFPDGACANTYKPAQFSWVGVVDKIRDKKAWKNAVDTSYAVLSGNYDRRLKGFDADHFYNPDEANPSWAKKCKFIKRIGRHNFHKC